MTTTNAVVERVLVSDDENDRLLLVRGDDAAAILEAATAFAEQEELVVQETVASVHVGNIRAWPCHADGHDTDMGSCAGDFEIHYGYGAPGPGSFRGAFVLVRYQTRAEREAAKATAEASR
jgi:hypothetical protein